MPAVIGIDFGTTYCNVGIWRNGSPEVIANHHGYRATPSMVSFANDEVLVGEAAATQASKNRKNSIYGFKWLIGRPKSDLEPHVLRMIERAPFKCSFDRQNRAQIDVVQEERALSVSPNVLCVHLFRHLKDIAEQFSGDDVEHCVLSVPADFTENQLKELKECGLSAKLPISQIITDPVAATIAHGLDRSDDEIRSSDRDDIDTKPKSLILVVDFGGIGMEATVLHRRDGVLSTACTLRDSSLSGESFISKLVDFCSKDFEKKTGLNIKEYERGFQKLKKECERCLKALSMAQHAEPFVEAAMEGVDLKTRITRMRFEDLCSDLFERLKDPIVSVLAKCDRTLSDVDVVIPTGGIANIPKITTKLRSIFPPSTHIVTGLYPDEAVAIGATLQAFLIQSQLHSFRLKSLPVQFAPSPVSIGLQCLPASMQESCTNQNLKVITVIETGALLPAQKILSLRLLQEAAEGDVVFDKAVIQVVQLFQEKPPLLLGSVAYDKIQSSEVTFDVALTLRVEGQLKIEVKERHGNGVKSIIVGPKKR